jgi:hypothetical protein
MEVQTLLLSLAALPLSSAALPLSSDPCLSSLLLGLSRSHCLLALTLPTFALTGADPTSNAGIGKPY